MPTTGIESSSPAHATRLKYDLLVLVVCGLIVKTMLMQFKQEVGFDEAVYLMGGRSFFDGDGFSIQGAKADVPLLPLYGIVAGAFYSIGASPEIADKIVHVVTGVGVILGVYGLGRLLFTRRVGMYAAGLAAAAPALNATVLYSGTHPLFLALALGALLLAIKADENASPSLAFCSGLLLGFGYLARADGLAWFATFAALLVVRALVTPVKQSWFVVAAIAVGFSIVFVPFTVRLQRTTGELVGGRAFDALVGMAHQYTGSTGAGETTPMAAQRARAEITLNSERPTGIFEVIRANPRVFALRFVRNTRHFFEALPSFQVFPFVLLPLAGIGFWNEYQRGSLSAVKIGWVVAATVPVCVYIAFGIQHRYLVPAVPVFLVFLAAGIDAIRPPAVRQRARAVLLFMTILMLAAASVTYLTYQRLAETVPGRFTREWARAIVKDAAQSGVARPVVVTSISKVPLYAGSHVRWVDTAGPHDHSEARKFLLAQNADYWLLLPAEQAAVGLPDQVGWLTPIFRDNHDVVIFRINKSILGEQSDR
jgi:hypothetical protein